MRLKVENLHYSYGESDALKGVSFFVNEGEFVGLIGPNGSGKSTALKNIYRGLRPDKGSIEIDGENLLTMSYKNSALKMAVVGQENDVPFDFMVEEIVAMGRTPHKKLFDLDDEHDKEIVHHALEHLGMESMAKKNYLHLSGGEKQRVIIARAIAQESDFYILDEPTNHLDISYQLQIFDFIKRLNVTVLSAIHDLNMAALYCDRLYVLKKGEIVLSGSPEEVLTEENIYNVYGVNSSVTKNALTGKVSISFLPAGVNK
ncbi:iron complex transport system ATP-binding protein [Acetitomaculum ruminis DSM 5522]|uniref:Iron complex transport system ATP-binding protein n=1 Tax=Acetitomaculum ruminis DSM 5522 TaxID=1120918 RepID=A0A1I0WEZ5_9FIRM|nr:ABC transporter ATP-binding protein [Acetitomaculum ruminis]SFA86740.1 iron complex transport system ATP-binding protein [Acetitomaculum ruminis DSM 5522]